MFINHKYTLFVTYVISYKVELLTSGWEVSVPSVDSWLTPS